MKIVTVEGELIKSINDFHHVIKESLDLPDYYGENLDALWDCLTGYIETPIKIIWKDSEKSKYYLNAFYDQVVILFREAEFEVDGLIINYN